MMLGNRPMSEWIARYEQSHQHPVNRLCHTFGIPLIAVSILLLVAAVFVDGLWPLALGLFLLGWVFQFVGHAKWLGLASWTAHAAKSGRAPREARRSKALATESYSATVAGARSLES